MILYSKGLSIRKIAKELDRSPSTISRELKEKCAVNDDWNVACDEYTFRSIGNNDLAILILKNGIKMELEEGCWAPSSFYDRRLIYKIKPEDSYEKVIDVLKTAALKAERMIATKTELAERDKQFEDFFA